MTMIAVDSQEPETVNLLHPGSTHVGRSLSSLFVIRPVMMMSSTEKCWRSTWWCWDEALCGERKNAVWVLSPWQQYLDKGHCMMDTALLLSVCFLFEILKQTQITESGCMTWTTQTHKWPSSLSYGSFCRTCRTAACTRRRPTPASPAALSSDQSTTCSSKGPTQWSAAR